MTAEPSAKKMTPIPLDDETKMAVIVEAPVALFERLARDPEMNVEKFERLMLMYERTAARSAEDAFNVAMSQAQTQIRPIAADADNPQTRSRYASHAQLDRALRPIYTEHGFGMSFDTGDSPLSEHVRVLAYVSHRAGHARTYHVDMPVDGKGAKGGDVMTKTHATGAGVAYGMRYLTKMIWNVAVGEEDRDGNAVKPIPPSPEGFIQWWEGLADVVPEGLVAYHRVWKDGTPECRTYVSQHLRDVHEARKAMAQKADRAGKAAQ